MAKKRRTAWLIATGVMVLALGLAACQTPVPAAAPAAPKKEAPAPKAAAPAPKKEAPAPKAAAPAPKKEAPAPKAKAAAPKAAAGPQGLVIIATNTSVTTGAPDPALANAGQGLRTMWPAYDGLIWLDDTGTIHPGLAESWKNIDDLTWEFVLGDYTFQNGRKVTSADVVGTFSRDMDPELGLAVSGAFVTVESVEAVDDKTIRVTTKEPDPTLAKILSLALIIPIQEYNAADSPEKFFEEPIGTGMYKYTSVDYKNNVAWTAMGADFKSPRGVPAIKDITMNFIGDEATQVAALRTGEVNISYPLGFDTANGLWSDGFKKIQQIGTASRSFLLDPTFGPTENKLVRQAINYAVDKDTMIKALFNGTAYADDQLLVAGVTGYNKSLSPYAYDLEKAKALMKEAGFENGFETRMTVIPIPGGKETGEAVAASLEDIGITVNIEIREVPVWVGEYYGTREMRRGIWFQVINWDQTFEPNSVWRWFSSDRPVDGGRRWDHQEFDDLYQEAKKTFDTPKRDALYQQAGAILYEEAPVLFLWVNSGLGASDNDIVWSPGLFANNWFAGLKREE